MSNISLPAFRKNFPRFLTFALCLVVLTMLPACGKNVHYIDSDKVIVDELEEYEENGIIVLNIVFENDDDDDVSHAVYRVEWFDENDKLLSITPWRPLNIRGGHRIRVVERSTMPGAKEHNIVLSSEHE